MPALGEATKHLFWRHTTDLINHLDDHNDITYPVYVPSKARSHYPLVTDLLDEHGVDYLVAVEPQDEDAYRTRFGDRLAVMPENDRGIAYVRNFMKDHAADRGFLYHWQVDDNVLAFRVRKDGKGVEVSPRHALSVVEQSVGLLTNVGGAGIANSAFVFGYDGKEPVQFNTQVYCAMLLRTDVAACFRPDVLFYAYTKEVQMFREVAVPEAPDNFRWIYSMGGRQDHLIDLDNERHAEVFPDEKAIAAAGYRSQEASDLYAITLQTAKVGIPANNIRHYNKKMAGATFGELQAGRHKRLPILT